MYQLKSDKFINDPSSSRKYKNVLYNILLELKPTTCLEIGGYYGGSAEVFQTYFNEHNKNGRLISADIKIYRDFNLPNVKQVRVHPHVKNSRDWHDVKDNEILPPVEDSATANMNIILSEIGEKFDFAFLDGDHQSISFWADYKICHCLTKFPHYILIDDISPDPYGHDSVKDYQKLIQGGLEHFEFDAGVGLVYDKS